MSAFVSLTRLLPCFDIQSKVIKQESPISFNKNEDVLQQTEDVLQQTEDNLQPRLLSGNVCILKFDVKFNLKDIICKKTQLNIHNVFIKICGI